VLVAIDIGNANIVIGAFDGESLRANWRLTTSTHRTADEYAVVLRALMRNAGIEPLQVVGVIVASVVPPLKFAIDQLIQDVFGQKGLWVEPGMKTGMPILYENQREVGADRIVNAVAAQVLWGKPKHGVIIVDIGTATTFDLVTPAGEYAGGAIAPGVTISLEALFARASKLPRVEFAKPPSPIGRNTVHSMQAGIFYGYAGLVDRVCREMKRAVDYRINVIATGGNAAQVAAASEEIEHVDDHLTLKGLKLLYERNARG